MIELQKKYRLSQKKFREDLQLYFDEFNVIKQLPYKKKEQLKKRYRRYTSSHELIKLYMLYLISLPTTNDILLELGILEKEDALFNEYEKIGHDRQFKQIGYEECMKDLKLESPYKQFKTKSDKEYIENKIIENTQKIKRQAQTQLTNEELKVPIETLDRQDREWLNIHDGKFSGYVERVAEEEYNQGYLEACKGNGVEQVQFIAIMDERTTDMCESLDLQVFNVKGKNKFYRYYDSVKTNKYTEVEGLVQGINLPPIDDNFHWCRSMIQIIKHGK